MFIPGPRRPEPGLARGRVLVDAPDQDSRSRFSPGRRPALLIYRVICVDQDTTLWPAEDLGNLRVALNALVRVFRLERR